ncbi:solute carrier family 41 [Pancytospora philotis]|nr:solute carrier family 41 [Pancytospora philotis]
MRLHDKLANSLNRELIVESAPTLLASLVGMLATGAMFESSIKQPQFKPYPIILIAGCILNFKGNAELNIAMHLSTRRSLQGSSSSFASAIFYNSCAALAQSFITGLLAGATGMLSTFMKKQAAGLLSVRMLTASLLTCCLTTLFFIGVLLLTIEIAAFFQLCMENFILPVLSTLNDFIIVKGLLLSTEAAELLSSKECAVLCLGMACPFAVAVFFVFRKPEGLYLNRPEVLLISYLITAASGFLLEKYAKSFAHVAAAFPVFAGMCGAITLIHAHRTFRMLQTREPDTVPPFPTLLLLSLFVSISYIGFAALFHFKYSLGFSVLFIVLFILQVFIFLLAIETIADKVQSGGAFLSADALPLISCMSDFAAVAALICGAYMLQKFA